MTMLYSNVKYDEIKGCFGNPRFYVGEYCYTLRCPCPVECEEERKKRRKENG